MAAKRYSDDDRLFALRWLDARGGNVRLSAREMEMPFQTLWQWSRGRRWFGWRATGRRDALTNRRVFKGRALPVNCAGEMLTVDLAKLTAAECATLADLLMRARIGNTDQPGERGRSI